MEGDERVRGPLGKGFWIPLGLFVAVVILIVSIYYVPPLLLQSRLYDNQSHVSAIVRAADRDPATARARYAELREWFTEDPERWHETGWTSTAATSMPLPQHPDVLIEHISFLCFVGDHGDKGASRIVDAVKIDLQFPDGTTSTTSIYEQMDRSQGYEAGWRDLAAQIPWEAFGEAAIAPRYN